jgi:hypothetical protein
MQMGALMALFRSTSRRTLIVLIITLFAAAGVTGVATAATTSQPGTTFIAANGDTCRTAPSSTGAVSACVHRTKAASPKTRSKLPRAVPNAAINVPTQCGMGAGGYTIPFPDRFTSCAGYNAGEATYLVYSDGSQVQTGEYDWSAYQWMQTTGLSDDPTWSHGVLLQGTNAWGSLASGVNVEVRSRCHFEVGICAVDDSYTDDTIVHPIAPGGSFSNEWLESDTGPAYRAPGLVDTLDGAIGVQYTMPSFTFGGYTYPSLTYDDSTGYINPPIAIRCDSLVTNPAGPAPANLIGCVDEQFTPTFRVSRASYGASADMIAWAQANLAGHWGLQGTGAPLHYLANTTQAGANRDVICDNTFVNGATAVPNDSCDEYPFAATAESGAMNGATSGSQCAQVTAVQTGTTGNVATDWATVSSTGTVTGNELCVRGHIPGTLNSGVGSIFGNPFVPNNRLIANDMFWVSVVP